MKFTAALALALLGLCYASTASGQGFGVAMKVVFWAGTNPDECDDKTDEACITFVVYNCDKKRRELDPSFKYRIILDVEIPGDRVQVSIVETEKDEELGQPDGDDDPEDADVSVWTEPATGRSRRLPFDKIDWQSDVCDVDSRVFQLKVVVPEGSEIEPGFSETFTLIPVERLKNDTGM